MHVDVALNLPLDRAFTFLVPPHLAGTVQRGARVLVPVRSDLQVGVVLSTEARPPKAKPGGKAPRVRPIVDVLDTKARALPEPLLKLAEWLGHYYHAPIGEAVHLALPSAVNPQLGQVVWRCVEGEAPVSDGLLQVQAHHLEDRIVEALQRHAATLQVLRERVPEATWGTLEALEKAGRIEATRPDESRQRRTDIRVSRNEGEGERKRLGAKQIEILEFIDEHGETTYSELRSLLKIQRHQIRNLEERGLVQCEEIDLYADPFDGLEVELRSREPDLTDEQQAALAPIQASLEAESAQTFLLHGVTGSGKTEVYLRAIRRARELDLDVVVLLPEIALTPQFVAVIREGLEEEIAVVHSQLTPARRRDQWLRVRRGEVRVVVGARSALFAPLERPGLIIVDEEHDPSFKQHEGVRYNARDAALVLAQLCNATVILGSATPSLESIENARRGRFALLKMERRVAARPMPDIELIDLKEAVLVADRDDGFPLSERLVTAVRDVAQRGEQAILFLNRRGYAPEVHCTSCGETLECGACEMPMTFHRRGNVMVCHYCGHTTRIPRQCPSCTQPSLELKGAGTERVEEAIDRHFSDLRIGRLDRDISQTRRLEQTLDRFRSGDYDVLVGTQMVTKGHDFPRVTLVGVLAGDQSLSFNDFRGGERTFQLLTQVAGRAGRGELRGEVLIQTYKPEHYVLQAVLDGDFERFVRDELRMRQRQGLPPFGHVALLRFSGAKHDELTKACVALQRALALQSSAAVHVGPAVDAPIPRIRERYRMQCLLRSPERAPLHAALTLAQQLFREANTRDVRMSLDVDPQSLF